MTSGARSQARCRPTAAASWAGKDFPAASPVTTPGAPAVIGQAKGILMERHGIAADAAFGVLSRVSQAENMKLAEIARRFAETGQLPSVSGLQTAGTMR
jgi:ANTAR domain-containing protein